VPLLRKGLQCPAHCFKRLKGSKTNGPEQPGREPVPLVARERFFSGVRDLLSASSRISNLSPGPHLRKGLRCPAHCFKTLRGSKTNGPEQPRREPVPLVAREKFFSEMRSLLSASSRISNLSRAPHLRRGLRCSAHCFKRLKGSKTNRPEQLGREPVPLVARERVFFRNARSALCFMSNFEPFPSTSPPQKARVPYPLFQKA
jgi:hypothetical protein